MLGGAGSAALLRVEQTDLINYGLIPEFVGRFPVISTLQACPVAAHALKRSAASPRSQG
jgi:ATP-dependent protease Clp ATPase subunit